MMKADLTMNKSMINFHMITVYYLIKVGTYHFISKNIQEKQE